MYRYLWPVTDLLLSVCVSVCVCVCSDVSGFGISRIRL